ncbi:uncharacterized protein [Euphorbia lathyris]|uniref:uncharacterized protein n=1 Tax=Euphorbia lathyris TaxID=212925 RepID=UPI0033136A80
MLPEKEEIITLSENTQAVIDDVHQPQPLRAVRQRKRSQHVTTPYTEEKKRKRCKQLATKGTKKVANKGTKTVAQCMDIVVSQSLAVPRAPPVPTSWSVRIDKDDVSTYEVWRNFCNKKSSRLVKGTEPLQPEIPWFIQAETPGKYWDGEHIDAFMYLLRRQSFENGLDADWTTCDSQFTGYIQLSHNLDMGHVCNTINGRDDMFMRPWKGLKRIFMPFNIKGNHWILGVLNTTNMHMYIYDSCLSNDSEEKLGQVLQRPLIVLAYAIGKTIGWTGQNQDNRIGWTRLPDTPQQRTALNDCGMLVCIFSQLLTAGRQLHELDPDDGDFLRLRVVIEIFHGKLYAF